MRYDLKDPKEFKANKIIEYFTSEDRIDVTDKNYESAIKLDNMINLFNADIDALSKYYQMKKIFRDSKSFVREYSYLEDFLHESTVLYIYDYVKEIAQYLQSIENNLPKENEKILFSLEKDNCFEDYPYAVYFVKEYIDYNDSPFIKDFFLHKGIYENDFNRFVNVLFRLDDNLYNEYLKKCEENKKLRQIETIRKVNNIKTGIKTGYTEDNEKFDHVEFFSNLPFDDADSSKEILDDFDIKKSATLDKRLRSLLETLNVENTNEIMTYIYTNSLLYGNPVRISENEIGKTNYILNDKALTAAGKDEIINYMKKRKIPFILPAFNAVKNKYFYQGLDKEKVLKK